MGSSQGGIARTLVTCPEVRNCTAVRNHHILEAPVVTQNLLQEALASAARLVVPTLVSAHHLTYIALLHTRLEGRHIGLPKVAWTHVDDVVGMTRILRSTVDSIMLGTGIEFAIFGVQRSLQALHHLHAHARSEVGILAVGLLSASPTWVTEDVHVRCPHRQAMETGVLVAVAEPLVVGSTSLVTHLVEDGIHHLVVERRSHADRFGINGHVAHVGNAVQGLAPPVELLDTQARNGIRHVKHQRRLLLQRQAAQQVLCTLTGRQFGILIWQHFLRRSTGKEHRHRHYNRYSLFHNGLSFW